jgi:hypothetical protein
MPEETTILLSDCSIIRGIMRCASWTWAQRDHAAETGKKGVE